MASTVKSEDVANVDDVVEATEKSGREEPNVPCIPTLANVVVVPILSAVLVLSQNSLVLFCAIEPPVVINGIEPAVNPVIAKLVVVADVVVERLKLAPVEKRLVDDAKAENIDVVVAFVANRLVEEDVREYITPVPVALEKFRLVVDALIVKKLVEVLLVVDA